ncbi:MAG: BON domain-containing protein [Planctomycetota bacterium]
MASQVAVADDGQVAQQLSEQLRNAQQSEQLKGFRINVKVENGVVWMKGSVKDKAQREKALDVARRVEGVRLVVNDLVLEGAEATRTAPVNQTVSRQVPVNAANNGRSGMQASVNAAAGSSQQQVPVMFVPVPYPASPQQGMAGQRGMAQASARQPRPQPRRTPVPVQSSRNRMVNYEGPSCPPGGCMNGGVCAGGACGGQYGGSFEGSYGGPYDGSSYYDGGGMGYEGGMGYGNTPAPEYSGGGAYGQGGFGGQGGVVYDEPQLPGYAWPGYAAHPNYAALQYPKQYSAQAWPYIGPFYPYPQVPLGWRKVSLEWDDGWWWLDFKSK